MISSLRLTNLVNLRVSSITNKYTNDFIGHSYLVLRGEPYLIGIEVHPITRAIIHPDPYVMIGKHGSLTTGKYSAICNYFVGEDHKYKNGIELLGIYVPT